MNKLALIVTILASAMCYAGPQVSAAFLSEEAVLVRDILRYWSRAKQAPITMLANEAEGARMSRLIAPTIARRFGVSSTWSIPFESTIIINNAEGRTTEQMIAAFKSVPSVVDANGWTNYAIQVKFRGTPDQLLDLMKANAGQNGRARVIGVFERGVPATMEQTNEAEIRAAVGTGKIVQAIYAPIWNNPLRTTFEASVAASGIRGALNQLVQRRAGQ